MKRSSRRPGWLSGTALIFYSIVLGVAAGWILPSEAHPDAYAAFRFLSKAFINLIKMLIVSLIFSTIVVGIGKTGDVKLVGRIGLKALIYFEVATTLALVLGLSIAHVVRPGEGLHLPPSGEAGVAMILAVDELMDMARTSINVMGNCVASVVVARWEGVLGKPIHVRDEEAPAAEIV